MNSNHKLYPQGTSWIQSVLLTSTSAIRSHGPLCLLGFCNALLNERPVSIPACSQSSPRSQSFHPTKLTRVCHCLPFTLQSTSSYLDQLYSLWPWRPSAHTCSLTSYSPFPHSSSSATMASLLFLECAAPSCLWAFPHGAWRCPSRAQLPLCFM